MNSDLYDLIYIIHYIFRIMFYHIVFKNLANNERKILTDIQYDILMNEYLKPYLNGDKLYIYGCQFSKEVYAQIRIYCSEYSFIAISREYPDSTTFDILGKKELFKEDTQNLMLMASSRKNLGKSNSLVKGVRNKERVMESKILNKVCNKKVFIIHGHDHVLKLEVQAFLLELGLEPIILHQQPNEGKTIIEKFEKHTDVGYGIALYTPCDIGKAQVDTEFKPRARQNVVFEHGILLGKLGRDRVAVIAKEGVEPPGDLNGIVWIGELNWKYDLRKELKAAGCEIKFGSW